jgi:hypothetical protein
VSLFFGKSMGGKLLWGAFATAVMAVAASDGNILGTAFSGTVAVGNLAGAAIDGYHRFASSNNNNAPHFDP